MIKLLQILNAALTVAIPIIAGALLTAGGFFETGSAQPWVFWVAYIPVGLLIFFIEVINFIKKLYPEKLIPLLGLLLSPYALFAVEWLFFDLGFARFLIGAGATYMITIVLSFSVSVIAGPWLTGAYRKYGNKEWASYAVATGAQFTFIAPGIIVLYAMLPPFLSSEGGANFVNLSFLIGTIALNFITQTKYLLARSIYATKAMGPEKIS